MGHAGVTGERKKKGGCRGRRGDGGKGERKGRKRRAGESTWFLPPGKRLTGRRFQAEPLLSCRQKAAGIRDTFPLVQGDEGRMEAWVPPSHHPLTSSSNKGGRREARLRSRASSAKGEEGAQVTAAPGNRYPDNRWQLHALRHCLERGLSNLSVPVSESFHPKTARARQTLAGTS